MNFRLTGYWNSLRGSEPYARITAFNVETIPGFGQHAFMLDLHNDPQDPMVRFAGQRLIAECGKNVTGQRLSVVPAGSLLARVAGNFTMVIQEKGPCEFAEELEKPNGDLVLYRGIMLPFSKDGTEVDYVVGAVTSKVVDQKGETVQGLSLEEHSGDPLIESQKAGSEEKEEEEETTDAPGARGLIALVKSKLDSESPAPRGGQPGLRASLDECQNLARKISAAESRSRKALYDTLERVYVFYHEAAADPEGFEALVSEAGLTMQERAPFTPIVKLVFGADYEKTRLSEYAAALSYAKRRHRDPAGFRSFIEAQDGGLKGCVKAERAARRAERGAGPDVTEEARFLLRETEALGLVTETEPGLSEFVVLLGRRSPAQPGVIEVLTVFDDKPATVDGLVRRAARQARKQDAEAEEAS